MSLRLRSRTVRGGIGGKRGAGRRARRVALCVTGVGTGGRGWWSVTVTTCWSASCARARRGLRGGTGGVVGGKKCGALIAVEARRHGVVALVMMDGRRGSKKCCTVATMPRPPSFAGGQYGCAVEIAGWSLGLGGTTLMMATYHPKCSDLPQKLRGKPRVQGLPARLRRLLD